MTSYKVTKLLMAGIGASALLACSATADTTTSPDVDVDGIDVQTAAGDLDGWTVTAYTPYQSGSNELTAQASWRNNTGAGAATRRGGLAIVRPVGQPGACTTDASCGPNRYCFLMPGGPVNQCYEKWDQPAEITRQTLAPTVGTSVSRWTRGPGVTAGVYHTLAVLAIRNDASCATFDPNPNNCKRVLSVGTYFEQYNPCDYQVCD